LGEKIVTIYGFGTTGIVPTERGLGTTGIVPTDFGFGTTGIDPTAFEPPTLCVKEIAKFVAMTIAKVITSVRNRFSWLLFDMVDSLMMLIIDSVVWGWHKRYLNKLGKRSNIVNFFDPNT
jgi:hypothetical protein